MITNTHATEYTLTLTNEDATAGNVFKIVSGASNVALFSRTGTAIYATGTAVYRPIGTADQTVAGTWTASTGSTTVTASGDVRGSSIRRDQSVWIGGRVFTAANVTYNATSGTTALLLSATYTGASTVVTMLTDAEDAISAWSSGGGRLFRVTTKGDWFSLGTHNVPSDFHGDSVDSTVYANGLWWNNANRRLYVPTIIMQRPGDPIDLAFRSAESASYPDGAPTQTLSGANMGALYWMGYASTGGWQYRSAVIYARAGQNITDTAASGSIVIGTTRQNQTAPTDSWWFNKDGSLQGANALQLGWLNGSGTAMLRVLDVDSGNNVNIARDDNIADVNVFNRFIMYRSTTNVTESVQIHDTGITIQSGSTLGVSGAATSTFIGPVSITGALTVTGVGTFVTRGTFSAGLTVSTGGVTIAGNSSITGTLSVSTLVTASAGLAVTTGPVTFPAASITSPAISLVDTNPSTGNALTARGPAKAWVSFTFDGTSVTMAAAYNVTAVTRITTGHYGITWATAFSSAEYVMGGLVYSSNNRFKQHVLSQTTGTSTVQVTGSANDTVGDPSGTWRVFVTAHGMQ